MLRTQFCLTFLSLFFMGSAALHAEDLRLNGAQTTVAALIEPAKKDVESAIGAKLKVSATNTGKGLVDLIEGRADVALTSEGLDLAVASAKSAGKDVKADNLTMHEIMTQEVNFIVHPSNPVSKLTFAQLKDIHLGKIKNWKEVGGPDLPIQVFIDAPAGGTRALVKKFVLNGEEYGSNCRALDNVKRIHSNVADFKAGIGGVGAAFVDKSKVKVLETDSKLTRPLGFITMGTPSPQVSKMIDAYKQAASKIK